MPDDHPPVRTLHRGPSHPPTPGGAATRALLTASVVLYTRRPQPQGHGPVPWAVRNRAAQQEVSGGQTSERSFIYSSPPLPIAPCRLRYLLNHPRQPQSEEKLSSTKPVPGAKKVGDGCPTQKGELQRLKADERVFVLESLRLDRLCKSHGWRRWHQEGADAGHLVLQPPRPPSS